MKPKFFPVLEQCIDQGITLGYNRAHKHVDNPSQEIIEHEIYQAVMNEIFEWFDFDELNTVKTDWVDEYKKD